MMGHELFLALILTCKESPVCYTGRVNYIESTAIFNTHLSYHIPDGPIKTYDVQPILGVDGKVEGFAIFELQGEGIE